MYVVNHQEHCGEYRYCPERHEAVVSLRGHAGLGQDGLHFSIKGIAVRVGYFIRIAVMVGRQIRERIPVLFRRYRLGRMGYRPQEIRRAICCARL
jgi:hypothetical protein